MNRAHFYAPVRSSFFGGALSQSQLNGMEAVLDEARKGSVDPRWPAHMLATASVRLGSSRSTSAAAPSISPHVRPITAYSSPIS